MNDRRMTANANWNALNIGAEQREMRQNTPVFGQTLRINILPYISA